MPKLHEQFGYRQRHGSAADHQDHARTWAWARRSPTRRSWSTRLRDLTADRRPEADGDAVAQVHRRLQDARGLADRLQGHAARASACTSSSTA
ncbi:MAG: hypothetical protein MZV65_14455 [Chromatiales bacterium]|nr:hypothetical protein [Chromatiales bacterium]